MYLFIYMYNIRINIKKVMLVYNFMKIFILVRFFIILYFFVYGKDLRFLFFWRNNLILLRDKFFFY